MILKIRKFTDPILRRKAKEIKEVNDEIRQLAMDMAETMKKNRGVGLAANQVGILKRIITIQPNPRNPEVFVLLNPEVVKKSKEMSVLNEGCLSYPKIFIDIERPDKIEVEGLNIKGEKIRLEAEGYLSHVFQHEIDHINGRPFFERLRLVEYIKFKLKHPWL